MVNDKEITSVMRQNAEKGFRLLMASYKEPVYWHIRRLVVSHADAQDAAQEAFVCALTDSDIAVSRKAKIFFILLSSFINIV